MENQKIDLTVLEKYVQEHLIVKQKHPDPGLNLWIYNYTPECVFSRKWDNITTQCRGLILDEEGNVIGRPFPKFFNYEELEGLGINLPEGTPKIFRKMDGSLIITTQYYGHLIVATRGSFVSDQSKLARDLLLKDEDLKLNIMYGINRTYLFELTGPDNRIVVNYPENKLTLLAIINNRNGTEYDLDFYRSNYCFGVVEEIKASWRDTTINYLQRLNLENEEGFVLKWDNGFRTKIKFPDYVRLHRLITGLNEKTIWEWMKDGNDINNLIKNVPEEFEKWIYDRFIKILYDFKEVYKKCKRFYDHNNLKDLTRKEAALLIRREILEFQSVLFNMLDNREDKVKENIWKLVKPKTNKVFKDEKEEL